MLHLSIISRIQKSSQKVSDNAREEVEVGHQQHCIPWCHHGLVLNTQQTRVAGSHGVGGSSSTLKVVVALTERNNGPEHIHAAGGGEGRGGGQGGG